MAFNSAADHEGGYDYDFVESPPDRLVCKICQFPCREAQLTVCCGHAFCKCCLSKLRSSSTGKACPTCRKEPFDAYVQLEADRKIKALKVYCPNKKDGCGWTGELANIVNNPLQSCERCDKCDDIIHYSDVHLPTNCPCYCPHCDTTADREVINSEHKEKCNKFPLRCPNNCGQDIPRDSMDGHKKVCPLEMVQCEYQCGARIVRNEVEKHNQEKLSEHIQLAHTVLSQLKTAQTAQLRSVEKSAFPIRPYLTITVLVIVIAIETAILLPSYIGKHDYESLWPLLFISDEISHQVAPAVILKMSDFGKRKQNKEQWYSKPFFAFLQGYQMCLSVYADGIDDGEGTHVSVYLYLMKGPHDDELERWGYWPLSGTFTIEVLNQLNDNDHYSHEVTFSPSMASDAINRVVDGILMLLVDGAIPSSYPMTFSSITMTLSILRMMHYTLGSVTALYTHTK